jgi:fumarate reductase flavoprotein subunit
MHGFNRLGGNSVAETVVSGMIVSEYIADFCETPESEITVSTGLVREFLEREVRQARRKRSRAAARRARTRSAPAWSRS